MTDAIVLTSAFLDPESGIRRDAPREMHLRDATYAERFDWYTLFYDVYRLGEHVVFQGPPFLNLFEHLAGASPFKGAFGFPRFRARHFGEKKRGEIWLRTGDDRVVIDNVLGHFDLAVQPDMGGLFAGRRVIHTLSKDNELRWIRDWIAFYRDQHGADGVLIYDNNSTLYSTSELQAELRKAFPGMAIHVLAWNFPYGPQAGRINNADAPWDSDFCQTGSLQHARFRFLQQAKSALNVDIDELVLSARGRSIFEATENSTAKFVKFEGHWIETRSDRPTSPSTSRHCHFTWRDPRQAEPCPPKWCIVPSAFGRDKSWSVHNLFGAKANGQVSDEFAFRHMRAISNSWKEDRWGDSTKDSLVRDEALASAFAAESMDAV